jgi:cysteine desulfurase/selenocysteine lyase
MPPWQGGGDMIETVTFEKSTFQPPPQRFEAGTPDISGAIGLDLAIGFIESIGRDTIYDHEKALTRYTTERLAAIPGVHVVEAGAQSIGVVSFTVDGVHPHDLATVLDTHNVAVRAGHHCAQPLMDRLGLAATTRASFGVYSDESDVVDALIASVCAARQIFGGV